MTTRYVDIRYLNVSGARVLLRRSVCARRRGSRGEACRTAAGYRGTRVLRHVVVFTAARLSFAARVVNALARGYLTGQTTGTVRVMYTVLLEYRRYLRCLDGGAAYRGVGVKRVPFYRFTDKPESRLKKNKYLLTAALVCKTL